MLQDSDEKYNVNEVEVHTSDEVVPEPQLDVDGIEDAKKGKAPRDSIDDYTLAKREELIDDRSEKEQMNQRPGCMGQLGSSWSQKGAHQTRNAHGAGVMYVSFPV